jgi:hypothetical protein
MLVRGVVMFRRRDATLVLVSAKTRLACQEVDMIGRLTDGIGAAWASTQLLTNSHSREFQRH